MNTRFTKKHSKLLRLTALCLSALLSIQTMAENYETMATRVRQEIWKEKHPAFEVRTIPEMYANESAVVIAEYNRYIIERRNRINPLFLFSNAVNHGMTLNTTSRQLIHIGDAVALEKYSQYDVTESVKSGSSLFNDKMSKTVVMGVRIYKADGTMKEINADDYIQASTTDDNKTHKKLAIPGLEIGDNLDIFVVVDHMIQSGSISPFAITFDNANAPTMSVEVHLEIDDVLYTRIKTLNGCPEFTKVYDKEKDMYILDASAKNMPARNHTMWYDFLTERPIALIYSTNPRLHEVYEKSCNDKGLSLNEPSHDIYKTDCTRPLFNAIMSTPIGYKNASFKLIKKDKNLSNKQKADHLFLTARHADFVKDNSMGNTLHTRTNLPQIAYGLKKLKIKYQVVAWTNSRNEPMDKLLTIDDMSVGLYLPEFDTYYLPTTNTTIAPGEILSENQGRKGILISEKDKYTEITLPSSTASDNKCTRQYEATVSEECDGLMLHQKTEATGTMKEFYDYFINDVAADSATYCEYGDPESRIRKTTTNATLLNILNDLDAKQNKGIEESLKSVMKKYFNTSDFELKKHEVTSYGFRPEDPVFRMNADIVLQDGVVSKAGRNIVVNIGRLTGDNYNASSSDRKNRLADIVYPTGARTLEYDISLEIPSGMTVGDTDLRALNTNVTNDCGSVTSNASIDGNKLNLKVTVTYSHPREEASKWSKVLELTDAQVAISNSKITLRKASK